MTHTELLDRKEELEDKLIALDWRKYDVKPILTELETINDQLEAIEPEIPLPWEM
jgi:hypothetical protein